jgi:putative phosphoribosyl transferase
MRRFANRQDAGRQLAARAQELAIEKPIVLGLPRGGVPVAFEVARALKAPLDVIVVRKLGVPFQPELAMGALGEDGVRVLNDQVLRLAHVQPEELEQAERRQLAEVRARALRFRGTRERLSLTGRNVIIVDDGIATGSTVRAALQVAKAQGARHITLAAPVAPADTLASLVSLADQIVCLKSPEPFYAVGQFYADFSQTTDDDVVRLLHEAHGAEDRAPPAARDEEVRLELGPTMLFGHLTVPHDARGLVLFAHGSGSSRHSPRNRFVAQVLNRAGIATLLFDLLTVEEGFQRGNVFDVELLGERLGAVNALARADHSLGKLPIGYFGASTGAAAALWAAAGHHSVRAVVSRGGRPDLAMRRLAHVQCPTLFIVGSRDSVVLELNREAAAHLRCEHRVEIVEGATHLFEELGTLETAAALARDWFVEHLPR